MFNLGTSVAKLTHRVNHHDVVASIMKECEVAWGRQSQWGGQEGLGLGFVGKHDGHWAGTARVVAALNKKQRNSSLGQQPSLSGPSQFPSYFKGSC